MRFHRHRAGARTAAAVRRREGLVQVEVHHVDAEIARPGDADERVHVGAVHVDHARPSRAGCRPPARMFSSKTPSVFGIGDHDGRDVFVDVRPSGARCPPARARWTGCSRPRSRPWQRWPDWCRAPNRESGSSCAGCRAIRAARGPAGCRHLAVRAGGRLQRDRVHAGDLAQLRARASSMISIAPCESDCG